MISADGCEAEEAAYAAMIDRLRKTEEAARRLVIDGGPPIVAPGSGLVGRCVYCGQGAYHLVSCPWDELRRLVEP